MYARYKTKKTARSSIKIKNYTAKTCLPVVASRRKNTIKSYPVFQSAVDPITIKTPLFLLVRLLRFSSDGFSLNNRSLSLVLLVIVAVRIVGSPSLLGFLLVWTWCAGSKVLDFDVFILLLPAIMSCRLLHCMLLWTLLLLSL
jgi:hypothetical protein